MAERVKVGVIGGGSVYTPELVAGLVSAAEEIGLDEVTLMDTDEDRLQVVGGLAQRMVRAAGTPFRLRLSAERAVALSGARFVITQLRVGGNAQRIVDEQIPLRYGIVGQETTGPGGFAMALRTVPVLLDLAREVRRLCPEAWVINFANPSGLATEALLRHGGVRAVGLCNLPMNMLAEVARFLGVAPERVFLDYVGLNHLSWVRRAYVDGRDVTATLLARAAEGARGGANPLFAPELFEVLGMLPCYYLRYYYHHRRVVQEQRQAGRTRAPEVASIDEQLLERYRDPDLVGVPPELARRGGALYSRAAVSLIAAIVRDKREIHIVSTQNRGAILDLPEEAVVEVPCVVGAGGPRPLACGRLPPAVRGLVAAVKVYEELTVEAAVSGRRRTAVLALMAHPLVGDYDVAAALVDAVLEANRSYLPPYQEGTG